MQKYLERKLNALKKRKRNKVKNKKSKRSVVLERIDFDAAFYADMLMHKGFLITEPAEISLDGTKQKSMYGPQSPLYGTTYEDEQAFIERCRCKCGAYKGRLFEGETCPYCNTKAESKDADIGVTGWISLGRNRIISPYYYNILCSALGKNIFPDIVNARYKITTDGNREVITEEDTDTPPSSPYSGIGVDAFYENYENIMTYFKSVRKNKADLIDSLIKEKLQVFTSHIPVVSTLLRPQSVTNDTFYFSSVDKLINTTFTLSENLKNCVDVERDCILARLQKKVNEMWDIYFDELNGKEGLIRGEILGGSINYSARNVIVPDPTLHDNEIDISYHTFLELFKYLIIYYIKEIEDVTPSKAYSIWKEASNYNKQVHDIMTYIVEKTHCSVLINRNPTLIVI